MMLLMRMKMHHHWNLIVVATKKLQLDETYEQSMNSLVRFDKPIFS